MKRILQNTLWAVASAVAIAHGLSAAAADFTLAGPVATNRYEQAPFKWHITPRHDYSKTFVTKLFLCQAGFDGEYLGRFKVRDNGTREVEMTCEEALEVIRGMDMITLGLPKIVYLVGWQYNGHDSKYPAFFEGNPAIARKGDKDPLDSVRWLMREAKKYHTTVSLHICLFDAYADSPLFEEYRKADVLARNADGSLRRGDWGYKVCYAAEWEKGLLQKRVDRLCGLLPVRETGTIHVDAFHNGVPSPSVDADGKVSFEYLTPISPWHGYTHEQDLESKRKIIGYFDAKGIDVTTEGIKDMDVGAGWFPMYWMYNAPWHALQFSAQQECGGMMNFTEGALFGDNVNAEGIFKVYRNDRAKAFAEFTRGFCEKTLIAQFLNRFGRKELLAGADGWILEFEDGVRTMLKGGVLSVAQGDALLAEGGDVFVPANWLGMAAMVAYSENGYADRVWTVPEGTSLPADARGWTVGPHGRTPFKGFSVKGRQARLTLAPGQMVLLASPGTRIGTDG